ncbi:MAG: hypothetical protein ACRC2M_03195, partial [Planktothrix sp.]
MIAIILFILFVIFLAYTIYYASRDIAIDTDSQTNFQQPIFTSGQVVYPTAYNGVPNANFYDIPTAKLGVAASQSATNVYQNNSSFVPLADFEPRSTTGASPLILRGKATGISPYNLVIAYPDQNIFTYANGGSWNQVNWFDLGAANSGIVQLANANFNNTLSIVKKLPDTDNILITGHGAGAGAAILAA